MSIQSYFNLTIQTKTGTRAHDSATVMAALLSSSENAAYAFEPDCAAADCVKWAIASEELTTFSAVYPEHEFSLFIHTPDFEAYERVLIHNGQAISSVGEIVYAPLDEDRRTLQVTQQ